MIDVDYKGDRFKIIVGSRTIYLDYEDFDTLHTKCGHMHLDYLITKKCGETNE